MMKRVAIVLLVSWLVCEVVAHSERFHMRPYKGGRLERGKPQQPEKYLQDIRAITTSGTNAEAYWNFQGVVADRFRTRNQPVTAGFVTETSVISLSEKVVLDCLKDQRGRCQSAFKRTQLSFQAIREPLSDTHNCDQIYTMNADGSDITLVSTGHGRDTCSYFTPDGLSVIYSSTQGGGAYCPPDPDMMYGYLWPIYKDMDVYKVDLATGNLTQLTNNEGYNAESTISPDGTRIVFTSDRDGDLELYSMDLDGNEIQRLTYTPGYDGGAYYSWDNSMLVWRANRPQGDDLTDYLNLLNLGLVEPTNMQIYVGNADGSALRPITNFTEGVVSFAPFFLPDDSGVIFSSNVADPMSGEFHLYVINLDGSGLTRITYEGSFNSFPMFSPDGQTLAWESNRNTTNPMDINVYLAEWAF